MIEENELPEAWTEIKLCDVAEINPGVDTSDLPASNIVSFIPMAAVEAGTGRLDSSTQRRLNEVRRGYTAFQEGDILFAKITPCMENGKSAVAKSLSSGLGFGSTEFHVLRPDEGVDPQLLYYFISQESFRQAARSKMTGSAGQLRVPASYLADVSYPLAPTNEQSRIVSVIEQQFTRLDAAVASLQRAKEKLKRYRASVLKAAVEGKLTEEWRAEHPTTETAYELLERILKERRAKWEADLRAKGKDPAKVKYVEPAKPDVENLPDLPGGWCWLTVEQLNPPNRPCAYGVLQPGPDVENGIPLVRVGDIENGQISSNNIKRIDPRIAKQYPRTKLEGGEVLMTLVGAIGRTAVVPRTLAGANTARAVAVIPLTERIEASWVENWFRSPAKVQEMISKSHEVARKTLNLEDVRIALVAVPPLAEQEQIVAEVGRRLSVISQLETTVDANLKRAERERQSILREAFAGRLVPQDPNDEPASVLLERIREERTKREQEEKLARKNKEITMTSPQDKKTRRTSSQKLPLRQVLVEAKKPIAADELLRMTEVGVQADALDELHEAVHDFYVELHEEVEVKGRIKRIPRSDRPDLLEAIKE